MGGEASSEDVLSACVLSEVDEAAARVGRVLVAGPRHCGLEVGRQKHLPQCAGRQAIMIPEEEVWPDASDPCSARV
jgi:hypothetical protein